MYEKSQILEFGLEKADMANLMSTCWPTQSPVLTTFHLYVLTATPRPSTLHRLGLSKTRNICANQHPHCLYISYLKPMIQQTKL